MMTRSAANHLINVGRVEYTLSSVGIGYKELMDPFSNMFCSVSELLTVWNSVWEVWKWKNEKKKGINRKMKLEVLKFRAE